MVVLVVGGVVGSFNVIVVVVLEGDDLAVSEVGELGLVDGPWGVLMGYLPLWFVSGLQYHVHPVGLVQLL